MKPFRPWCLPIFALLCSLASFVPLAQAEVRLSNLFSDHMVLQRDQPIVVWGWGEKGEEVALSLGELSAKATTDENGRWRAELEKLPAGGPHQLVIRGKSNEVTINDVLVGEVWVCSGQSNMRWTVAASNDADLERLTANYPNLRLLKMPNVGTQEPQEDFDAKWQQCTPETANQFSAVGYFFGRQLHQTLDVPVGLIDNSWGGSSAEAWVRRDLLEADERYTQLMDRWRETEANYDHEQATARFEKQLAQWEEARDQARADGKPVPNRPRPPQNPLANQHRPANLYNGSLKPIIGYGIRGAIWYQGESNAGRAYQYRELFPLMIQNWRDDWGQGDFPFYWVQLANFRARVDQPQPSNWAELQEAQTMTLDRLPNTGQAVINDLGESDDIHPRNKQDVAKRLARLALANDYGYQLIHQSPRYQSMKKEGNKIVLTFDTFGSELIAFDTKKLRGFAIAGEDQKFVWADAKITSADTVEVTSDQVKDPVAVRYAWAENPDANLRNRERLPVTPFRTDEWEGVTANNHR